MLRNKVRSEVSIKKNRHPDDGGQPEEAAPAKLPQDGEQGSTRDYYKL